MFNYCLMCVLFTLYSPYCCTESLQAFGNCMTEYEQEEIKGYNDIWFLGLAAKKIHGTKHTKNNNHGFDNEENFYQPVTFCW